MGSTWNRSPMQTLRNPTQTAWLPNTNPTQNKMQTVWKLFNDTYCTYTYTCTVLYIKQFDLLPVAACSPIRLHWLIRAACFLLELKLSFLVNKCRN